MRWHSTDHTSHWVAVVRELGPGFAARAARHDAEDTFVADNYAELRAHRVFSAGVPVELGGGGASHDELADALRILATYCSSTALALSMHTHQVLIAGLAVAPRAGAGRTVSPPRGGRGAGSGVERWVGLGRGLGHRRKGRRRLSDHRAQGLRQRRARGRPADDDGDLRRPGGGTDRSSFRDPADGAGSEGPGHVADARHARDRLPRHGARRRVRARTPPSALRRPAGRWSLARCTSTAAIALPLIYAVYVGVAEAARALALEVAAKRRDDPTTERMVGEMENELTAARMALRHMLDAARARSHGRRDDRPGPHRAHPRGPRRHQDGGASHGGRGRRRVLSRASDSSASSGTSRVRATTRCGSPRRSSIRVDSPSVSM